MKTANQISDEELVLRYQNGDNAAFETLLLRHKTNLFSNILSLVRNRELAEDIFQDTFLKAIVTIQQGRYVETGRFLGWLLRVARNLIIDHFRCEKNENTFSADDAQYDILNDARLSEVSIEEVMTKEQMLNDVVALVDDLPNVQRNVLKMRIFEGMSFKEIAEKTDVSVNTSIGRMRYALMNMRRLANEKKL